MKSVEVQNKTERPIPPRLLAVSSVSGSRNSPQAVFTATYLPPRPFPRDGYSTGLALPFSATVDDWEYIYVSGSYGRTKRSTAPIRISRFGILARFGGPRITSRNIRELLAWFQINDAIRSVSGDEFTVGRRPVVCTTPLRDWPGAMCRRRCQARIYALPLRGTLYNRRQYQGSLNYIFRFDTLGSGSLSRPTCTRTRRSDYDCNAIFPAGMRNPSPRSCGAERATSCWDICSLSRLGLNKNFSEERSFSAG